MPAKPFVTDTRQFPRKEDAKVFFRAMLNRYRPGDKVSDADSRDLAALLKHHTEYAAKVGGGIVQFNVIANLYNTKSFEIVRRDGSKEDFSYIHCITPKRD